MMTNKISNERLQELLKFYSDSPITWETRDIIQELLDLRKEKAELIDCVDDMVRWLDNAPFDYSNGNTSQGSDEGDYYGWKAHEELVSKAKALMQKMKGDK